MRSFFMKLLLIIIVFMPCVTFAQKKNAIDRLRTDNDVVVFLKGKINLADENIKFINYSASTKHAADSLNAKNWFKLDLDKNGETDLAVLRLDGIPYFKFILSKGDKYETVGPGPVKKYNIIYPVVKYIDQQLVFLVFHQTQQPDDIDELTNRAVKYTPLKCDSAVLINGYLVNYSRCKLGQKIKSMYIKNNGICEGRCPVLTFKLDFEKHTGYGQKNQDWNQSHYHAIINSNAINLIASFLSYTNLSTLSLSINTDEFDDPTTVVDIIYNSSIKKKIIDPASSGNLTLLAIYDVLLKSKWVKE
jgi:hypothetical protein